MVQDRGGILPPMEPPGGGGAGGPEDPHYSGLSTALAEAPMEIERRIARRATEVLHAWRTDGSEIGVWMGGTDRVRVPAAALPQFTGAVVTHNHPAGSGFSWQGVRFAIANHLAELRVITPAGGLYRLRRPDGAENWDDIAYLFTSPRRWRDYVEARAAAQALLRAAHPHWPPDRLNAAVGEAMLLYLARTYGVRYSGLLP